MYTHDATCSSLHYSQNHNAACRSPALHLDGPWVKLMVVVREQGHRRPTPDRWQDSWWSAAGRGDTRTCGALRCTQMLLPKQWVHLLDDLGRVALKVCPLQAHQRNISNGDERSQSSRSASCCLLNKRRVSFSAVSAHAHQGGQRSAGSRGSRQSCLPRWW